MEEVKPKYPEHAKFDAIKDQAQTIGEFLEWLESQRIELHRDNDGDDGVFFRPVRLTTPSTHCKNV